FTSTSFFSPFYVAPRLLHSFPTRRSSDLLPVGPDHEQVAVVEAVLGIGGAVPLADHAPGVAREHILELVVPGPRAERIGGIHAEDRKSTRLNSSHVKISYAVFCLKKKKKT